jgi:hypothetical protein
VYREVALQNGNSSGITPVIITVSVDEKPGLQAIANTARQTCRRRRANMHRLRAITSKSVWEPVRFWRALDLHNGHVTARIERRHRSREFIALLKDLDAYYPAECTIRLILDNHSAHISKETRTFLTTRPNRFKYVLTPTHGSWL